MRFDDGVAGDVDLSDSAALGGIFEQWSDEAFWRSAHIVADSGAVAWGDGTEVDVCPLSLYRDVTGRTLEDLQAETSPRVDEDFTARARRLIERDRELLDRLAAQ